MKKNNAIKAAGDLFYTVMATVIMNVVTQIIIYPLITYYKGNEVTGDILYFIGIIYIVPQALGTALHNVRLMMRKTCDITNRDFLPLIAVLSTASALICGYIGFADTFNLAFSIAYALFSVIYLLRIYATVEFRLDLKIKQYFFYFLLICAGYLAGFGLYMLTNIWLLIFVVGEALALAHTFTKGKLFRNDSLSGNRSKINKVIIMVLLSTIVRDCVNQFDKVILKQAINSSVVTQYHVVSLIAKTLLMLVQPINSLILTYLTIKDSVITKKQLIKFSALSIIFGGIFYGACLVGTPIFVKLFYPDLYDTVMPYNAIVNLGLIIGFISTMFMSILLTQGKTAIQMTIQFVWGVLYIATATYFVGKYQIWGLAYVTLVANSLKLIAALAFMFYTKNVKQHKILKKETSDSISDK